MNPITVAMRRPITVMVAVLAIVITCFLAIRPKAHLHMSNENGPLHATGFH